MRQFNSYQSHQGRSRFADAKVTKWLLIALGILFLVDIVGMGDSIGRLMRHFALGKGVLLEFWRWGVYPFVNLNITSWLFSMIILFMFGRMAEQRMGSRRYLVLLVYTTLLGAAVYVAMSGSSVIPLTGASGLGITVLVTLGVMYPDQQVQLLIPPMPVKLKTMVFVFIGFMVVMAIAQRADPAVTLAHLSGVVVSLVCMKNMRWLDVFDQFSSKKLTIRKSKKETQSRSTKMIKRSKVARFSKSSEKKSGVKQKRGMKPRTILNMNVSQREEEIDRILDKVSAEGIGNLTDEEREILKFASKK